MADSVGMGDLRNEDIERMVTGFALQNYKMKQLCTIQSTNALLQTYYQETSTELAAGATQSIKAVGRYATFPYVEETWTKVQAYIDAYGTQGVISYQDIKFSNIDVVARTLLRVGRAVAKAVDDQIWAVISESQSAVNINTFPTTAAWDAASGQKPMLDIYRSIEKISEANYEVTDNVYLLVNPYDYASLLAYIFSVGAQAPELGNEVGFNGRVGKLGGAIVIVSNTVTTDYALVAKGGECATWKSAEGLSISIIDDPKVKRTIRAFEMGVTELTNPKAICLITNTKT